MNEQSATKAMGMLLQDPTLRDAEGNLLHADYSFSLDEDALVGTGSSKLIVRDENEKGVPIFSTLNWGDAGVSLSFDDFNRNPLERPIRDNPWFHQVNCFAVAAHTLEGFEQALGRELAWREGGPLVIRPHAFQDANAYYAPSAPSLNFGYFESPFRPETVWTCLSHDIVAHELGHAIFDSFRPLFVYSYESDTHALHESVGDLLALFSALEHPGLVERLYGESGGDMRRPTFASGLAEEFGIGLNGSSTPYLRSALEGPPYGDEPQEAHARSTIWTAAIYEILVEFVATLVPSDIEARRSNFNDFKQSVVTATDRTRTALIHALHYAPPTGVTMPVLARLIDQADQRRSPADSTLRDIAKRVFEQRELWDETILLDSPGVGPAFGDFDAAGPAARTQMVAEHADALRIPLNLGPRILLPRMFTATRELGTGENAGGTDGQAVTERYLHFAYEWTDLGKGPDFEPVGVVLYGGGTLVMDENFNDIALVTDPPAVAEDLNEEDPALRALTRSADRFRALHSRSLRAQCARTDRASKESDVSVFEAAAFRIEHLGAGAARLVGRPCNIAEHLTAISRPHPPFSFASRVGLDYSGLSGAFDLRGGHRPRGTGSGAARGPTFGTR